LPALCDAIARLLSPRHKHGDLQFLGVLLEPAEHPWRTDWHRDWRDHMPAEVFEEEFRADWDRQVFDINYMNQINCPLYDDNCTWFVPGSHYRQQNTPGELAVVRAGKASAPATATDEELERANLQYCQAMPGAVQLCLNAGDFAIYRPTAWHLGNYVPYRKRATLHDGAMTPEQAAYIQERGPRHVAAMKRWADGQKLASAKPLSVAEA